ncbi:MAG: hypothetical protein MR418_12350 [Clostridiales bacterium]|nr:hypothetical protein [Clostridiales bacterium]
MSFLSDIATALAIILVSCGVNLTEISGGEVSVPAVIATEAPATTESATPEPTAESETDPAQPAASPEATAPADVQSAQSAVAASFVTEAEVESDVQTLATQMYAGIISGVKYQAPAIVEDNADTHLSTRWVDYMAASTARDDSTKLTAFSRPGVVPAFRSMYADGAYIVAVSDCTVTLKNASSETQETRFTFTLKYANNVSGRKIVSIDINGDADYDTLKSALDAGADVSAIDASVDSAISALN